jgi:hypothetical protein
MTSVILRCTRRLLRLLGTPAVDPGPVADSEAWGGNLRRFDRRKCLLLTHAGTLYTVFHAGVRTADLRDTHRFAVRLVGCELACGSLPAAAFGALEEQELIVARTAG